MLLMTEGRENGPVFFYLLIYHTPSIHYLPFVEEVKEQRFLQPRQYCAKFHLSLDFLHPMGGWLVV